MKKLLFFLIFLFYNLQLIAQSEIYYTDGEEVMKINSEDPNQLAIIKDFFAVVGNMMVMSDGKKHTSRRKAGGTGINEELLKKYEIQIQNVVNKLLAPLKENKRAEFVEDIARQLPQSVLADLFSIPTEDRAFFNKCSKFQFSFYRKRNQLCFCCIFF